MRKRRIVFALVGALYLWFIWPMRQYLAYNLGKRLGGPGAGTTAVE